MGRGLPLLVLLWLGFAAGTVATGALLLRACGFRLLPAAALSFCPLPSQALTAETERQRELSGQANAIRRELELRRLACASAPKPTLPPLQLPHREGAAWPQQTALLKPPPSEPILKMPEKPTQDLSFLKGCWRTDPFKHEPGQRDFGISTYCFDTNGRGQLEFRISAHSCRPSARAQFLGNVLRIDDADVRCSDGTQWAADHLDCRRASDGVAQCSGDSRNPVSGLPTHWTVRLHRVN